MKKKILLLQAIYVLIGLIPVLSLAQETPQQIPLWPEGAPGFEDRRNEPEQAKDWWVRNHAFNMGKRSELKTISTWPQRLADWLADNHFMEVSKAEKGK